MFTCLDEQRNKALIKFYFIVLNKRFVRLHLFAPISTCVSTKILIRQIFSFLENVYYTTHKILNTIMEVEARLIIPVLQLHCYKYSETCQLFIKHSKQYLNSYLIVYIIMQFVWVFNFWWQMNTISWFQLCIVSTCK